MSLLKGKGAVVTGAASGIGKAIATAFIDAVKGRTMMMIDAKRYTSGRIAVADLSTSIESLERRRVEVRPSKT